MLNLDSDEAIRERREFYNNESTRKFLKKDGVPRSKRQARTLVTTGMNKQVDDSLIRLFLHVYFEEHTQQINIRDKSNGKIIVSIRK